MANTKLDDLHGKVFVESGKDWCVDSVKGDLVRVSRPNHPECFRMTSRATVESCIRSCKGQTEASEVLSVVETQVKKPSKGISLGM